MSALTHDSPVRLQELQRLPFVRGAPLGVLARTSLLTRFVIGPMQSATTTKTTDKGLSFGEVSDVVVISLMSPPLIIPWRMNP